MQSTNQISTSSFSIGSGAIPSDALIETDRDYNSTETHLFHPTDDDEKPLVVSTSHEGEGVTRMSQRTVRLTPGRLRRGSLHLDTHEKVIDFAAQMATRGSGFVTYEDVFEISRSIDPSLDLSKIIEQLSTNPWRRVNCGLRPPIFLLNRWGGNAIHTVLFIDLDSVHDILPKMEEVVTTKLADRLVVRCGNACPAFGANVPSVHDELDRLFWSYEIVDYAKAPVAAKDYADVGLIDRMVTLCQKHPEYKLIVASKDHLFETLSTYMKHTYNVDVRVIHGLKDLGL